MIPVTSKRDESSRRSGRRRTVKQGRRRPALLGPAVRLAAGLDHVPNSRCPGPGVSAREQARAPSTNGKVSPRNPSGELLIDRRFVTIAHSSHRAARVVTDSCAEQHDELPRQYAHERLGLIRRNQPRPRAAPLDPYEAIDARDVHLHDPPALGPKPAEPAPQTPGADAHASSR